MCVCEYEMKCASYCVDNTLHLPHVNPLMCYEKNKSAQFCFVFSFPFIISIFFTNRNTQRPFMNFMTSFVFKYYNLDYVYRPGLGFQGALNLMITR